MAQDKNLSKKKWEKALSSLSKSLSKEVHIMRELLANLRQEELSLLENDRSRFRKLIKERSELVLTAYNIRSKRSDHAQTLETLAAEQKKSELFPAEDDISVEILHFLDQIEALIERTNLQNRRNEILHADNKGLEALSCPFPMIKAPKPKKKTSVATYKADR